MTSAVTADRILAGAYITTDMKMARGLRNMRDQLATRDIPVIVADNIAEYVHRQAEKGREYRIGAWPCLAPPWEWAWIEYPNATGNQRRGAWMISFDLKKASHAERNKVMTGMLGETLKDAAAQSPGEETRWALCGTMFVDDGRRVAGPMGAVMWALDEHGKELGNRWFLRPEQKWAPANDDEAMWLHSALIPALQTIAFMHCRNVVIDKHARPEKLAKAYRKRHGKEPLRWQTVRLELPRKAQTTDNPGRPGDDRSLHIVTGHFAHYGDCCPTQHEPNGKLFGRLEGIYWMPMHLRGDPTHEVRTDRVVTLGSEPGGDGK